MDSAHIPKTGKFCMSGTVKFSKKSPIIKPAGNHPYYFLERSKTEKFCMSGLVKFGEKSQNVKPAGNHPYYFVEWSDHVKEDIRLVGSI